MITYTIASAIISFKGKYLIGKRSANKKFSPNRWEFISGFIEEKESAEETILRELKEETNLNGKIIKSANPYWEIIKDERWIVLPFLIEADSSTFKLNLREHSELKWVNKNELNDYSDLFNDIKNMFKVGMLK